MLKRACHNILFAFHECTWIDGEAQIVYIYELVWLIIDLIMISKVVGNRSWRKRIGHTKMD